MKIECIALWRYVRVRRTDFVDLLSMSITLLTEPTVAKVTCFCRNKCKQRINTIAFDILRNK